MLFSTLVLPAALAVDGFSIGAPWSVIPLTTFACTAAIRLGLAVRFHKGGLMEVLLLPLAWSIIIAIGINSIHSTSSQGASWKGRMYRPGR